MVRRSHPLLMDELAPQSPFDSRIVRIIRNYQGLWDCECFDLNYISPYLFLQLALLLFLLGFGWEQWKLRDIFSRWFLLTALGLAVLGFAMDQVAIRLGVWAYTNSGIFKVQLLSMPIEEYCLFFLHSLFCLIFVRHYSAEE